jgi:regulator of protease activity HflC (stomatin/prohibitin superfamily)
MFDKLIEILQAIREKVSLWEKINHYDRGVRLRGGKFKRPGITIPYWRGKSITLFKLSGKVLEPGIHWKLPVFDDIITTMVMPTTVDLTEQSLTTRNGRELVIECSVKYSVSKPDVVLLECYGAVNALTDMSKDIVRSVIAREDWPLVDEYKLKRRILNLLKREAKRWGIRVIAFNIASLAPMRSVRVLMTQGYKNNEINL